MTGSRPAPVNGLRLRLRPVELSDAAYIHGLRTDSALNAHLSAVTGTVADQRAWIADYLRREAAGHEVYFVIERRADGQSCGVVRLYGIAADRFTWGSWILDAGKPPKAALESAILSMGFGFEVLSLEQAEIDVRCGNHHAIAFYRRFGATETGADGLNLYFTHQRARFLADRPRLWAALDEEAVR